MGVSGRFAGKVVLVTGGAHGIGLATASRFCREGAAVCLFDRDETLVPQVVADLGSQAMGWVGDVRCRGDVEAALAQCERQIGPVDILMNNAGYARSSHILDLTESSWDEILGVCLTGVFRVAQTVARSMARRNGGVILNACASSAIASEPGLASYAAAKAGVLALTRAMALELSAYRVRVCTVLPGEISTAPFSSVEMLRIYESRIPAGRSGSPQEAAAAYLYLASADARQLNGAAFVVDGGMLAWE